MGDLVKSKAGSYVPTPVDHLALRALLKYLSVVLEIPYKSISENESQIKNYASNKSIKDKKLPKLFQEYSQAAAACLAPRLKEIQGDDYGLFLVKYLFGEEWLRANGLDVTEKSRPATLSDMLMRWFDVSDDEAAQVEQRYRGLWRVMRASSPASRQVSATRTRLKDINYSLLNIRPRNLGQGGLCEFRWYYRARYSEKDETRVYRGFVIPNVDRLEFLGRLDSRHRPIALMSWRFTPDSETTEHTEVANGISLSLNSEKAPVTAHIRAFFVHASDSLEGDDFDLTSYGVQREGGLACIRWKRSRMMQYRESTMKGLLIIWASTSRSLAFTRPEVIIEMHD